MDRDWIGRCLANSFLYFSHHFGGMARRSDPEGACHLALLVNFDIQYAHSVKHGRHAALEDASAIDFVKVFGGIYSVFFGSSCI